MRVPVTPNEQGTREMRDDVLSKVVEQNMDSIKYQTSYMDDVEFVWENDQLDVDAAFRPSVDTSSSPTAFDDLEVGCSAENTILLDEEEDKENSPPTTTVFLRLTRTRALLRIRPFATRLKNGPDMFIEICFIKFYRVSVLI